MSNTQQPPIVLEIAGTEFSFFLTPELIDRYINALLPNSKTAPMHNLLIDSVAPEQKEVLKPYLQNSLQLLQIGGELLAAYGPELSVTVKKPRA